MTLNRKTGTAVGLGIGLVLSLILFGISRFFRTDTAELTRAQAFRIPEEAAASPVSSAEPPAASPTEPPTTSDSLLQRLNAPAVIDTNGLAESITQIFATPQSTPPPTP